MILSATTCWGVNDASLLFWLFERGGLEFGGTKIENAGGESQVMMCSPLVIK